MTLFVSKQAQLRTCVMMARPYTRIEMLYFKKWNGVILPDSLRDVCLCTSRGTQEEKEGAEGPRNMNMLECSLICYECRFCRCWSLRVDLGADVFLGLKKKMGGSFVSTLYTGTAVFLPCCWPTRLPHANLLHKNPVLVLSPSRHVKPVSAEHKRRYLKEPNTNCWLPLNGHEAAEKSSFEKKSCIRGLKVMRVNKRWRFWFSGSFKVVIVHKRDGNPAMASRFSLRLVMDF